jgi:hypothetical protein
LQLAIAGRSTNGILFRKRGRRGQPHAACTANEPSDGECDSGQIRPKRAMPGTVASAQRSGQRPRGLRTNERLRSPGRGPEIFPFRAPSPPASGASFCSWAAVVCGRCGAGRPSPSRRSVILPRGRGGGKHFFRVPRPGIRSGPAIAVTTRFRARSRTFFSIPGIPIPEDPIEAQRRPGRVDLPTEVFHRKREVSVQPRAAGTPNEPGDGDAVADRSDRSQRRRGGKDRPTEFSAVPGVCPRTITITGAGLCRRIRIPGGRRRSSSAIGQLPSRADLS